MFETFKNERAYQWHDKGSREGTASCRRDTAKVKKRKEGTKSDDSLRTWGGGLKNTRYKKGFIEIRYIDFFRTVTRKSVTDKIWRNLGFKKYSESAAPSEREKEKRKRRSIQCVDRRIRLKGTEILQRAIKGWRESAWDRKTLKEVMDLW